MSHLKKERNNKLIKLRDKDPVKWSFSRLGKEFNISKITAYQIYLRDNPNARLDTPNE